MQYYEYLLVYMDDMLMISHEPQITMDALGRQYHMKEGSVGKSTKYLGTDVIEYTLPGNIKAIWRFSFQQCIQEAIQNVEMELIQTNHMLPNTANTLMSSGYCLALDVTPHLNDAEANWYRNMIGVLRWAINFAV